MNSPEPIRSAAETARELHTSRNIPGESFRFNINTIHLREKSKSVYGQPKTKRMQFQHQEFTTYYVHVKVYIKTRMNEHKAKCRLDTSKLAIAEHTSQSGRSPNQIRINRSHSDFFVCSLRNLWEATETQKYLLILNFKWPKVFSNVIKI